MRIQADSLLRHRRDAVFEAYRDGLGALVAHLPNVRSVELIDRQVDGPVVRVHKLWHGALELPANLSTKLDQRFLSWDDRATWDPRTWSCEWVIEPHILREAVVCRGRTDFVDLDGARTRIELTGDLQIELAKVRGVPSFLAASLARTAERFLVRAVLSNLESVSEALEATLREDTLSG